MSSSGWNLKSTFGALWQRKASHTSAQAAQLHSRSPSSQHTDSNDGPNVIIEFLLSTLAGKPAFYQCFPSQSSRENAQLTTLSALSVAFFDATESFRNFDFDSYKGIQDHDHDRDQEHQCRKPQNQEQTLKSLGGETQVNQDQVTPGLPSEQQLIFKFIDFFQTSRILSKEHMKIVYTSATDCIFVINEGTTVALASVRGFPFDDDFLFVLLTSFSHILYSCLSYKIYITLQQRPSFDLWSILEQHSVLFEESFFGVLLNNRVYSVHDFLRSTLSHMLRAPLAYILHCVPCTPSPQPSLRPAAVKALSEALKHAEYSTSRRGSSAQVGRFVCALLYDPENYAIIAWAFLDYAFPHMASNSTRKDGMTIDDLITFRNLLNFAADVQIVHSECKDFEARLFLPGHSHLSSIFVYLNRINVFSNNFQESMTFSSANKNPYLILISSSKVSDPDVLFDVRKVIQSNLHDFAAAQELKAAFTRRFLASDIDLGLYYDGEASPLQHVAVYSNIENRLCSSSFDHVSQTEIELQYLNAFLSLKNSKALVYCSTDTSHIVIATWIKTGLIFATLAPDLSKAEALDMYYEKVIPWIRRRFRALIPEDESVEIPQSRILRLFT